MTPPTNDSNQTGSWKEDVSEVLNQLFNSAAWWGYDKGADTPNAHVGTDTNLKVEDMALQAIIEANKKWLIGQNFPKADPNHDSEWENGRVTGINELHEEQRKAME